MSLSLQNTENYRENFQCCVSEIFIKYVGLIREYLIQCIENIYIRNTTYYRYVVYKGITTITHVFLNLLLYTRNLDLTYHHCQKSFYYYVEFIGRIEDDNHSFLQLNSKDASLFVYKKTIFDINSDTIKNYTSNDNIKNITKSLDLIIDIYNNILFRLLSKYNSNSEIIKIINIDFQKIIQKIIKSFIDIDDIYILKKIYYFIVNLKEENNIIENTDLFIKKLKKKDYNKKNLDLEIINQQTNNNTNPNNYINNIFNNL